MAKYNVAQLFFFLIRRNRIVLSSIKYSGEKCISFGNRIIENNGKTSTIN
jgi:hypothetical protein